MGYQHPAFGGGEEQGESRHVGHALKRGRVIGPRGGREIAVAAG